VGPAFLTVGNTSGGRKKSNSEKQIAANSSCSLGQEFGKLRCDEKLREIGLDLSPSISSSQAGEEGDEYWVAYPIGSQDKKRLLDLHLTKGVSREARFCLRIYFFWDDEAKRVVIGWLPGHLDTQAT